MSSKFWLLKALICSSTTASGSEATYRYKPVETYNTQQCCTYIFSMLRMIHSCVVSLTVLGYLPALRRTKRPGPISRFKRIIDSERHTMMTLYLPPLHIMHTFTHRRCIGSYNSVAAPSFQTNLHPVETKELEASEHRKVQRKQQSAVSYHTFQCKYLYPHMRVCRWNC